MSDKAHRNSEASFRTLVETLASPVFVSGGNRFHYVNHAAAAITGYTLSELLSMDFCDLVHPDAEEAVILRAGVHEGETGFASPREVRILTKNHEECWLEVIAAAIDFDGAPARLFSAFDLTKRKRAESQARLLAITDPLTGLGNYRRIRDVLRAEIERSGRTRRPFAVLLLDLDGLKKVNDRYGHLAGSRALCRIGDVLRLSCRGVDTAARYGGDEFAVILPETTASAAAFVASRIRKRIATDMEEPTLSVSIGVSVYPQDGATMEDLLQAADRELYKSKSQNVELASFARHQVNSQPASG